MEVRDFIKGADRLCNYYKECVECPLYISGSISGRCYWVDFGRKGLEENNKVIDIVEEWAKEHPAKTRQGEMLKLFPYLPDKFLTKGFLNFCPKDFDSNYHLESCSDKDCCDCQEKYWLEEIE